MGALSSDERHKLGCLLLVTALLLTALWLRSHSICDEAFVVVGGRGYGILSWSGSLFWWSWDSDESSGWNWSARRPSNLVAPQLLRVVRRQGLWRSYSGIRRGEVHYLFLTMPITIVSAVLILWKQGSEKPRCGLVADTL